MNTTQLDDIVRAIVHQLTGEDAALFPTTTPGVALGLLDACGAAQFASIAQDLTNDRLGVVYDADGRCRLEPVA